MPEYIEKTLYGQARKDVREIIRVLCKYKKVGMVEVQYAQIMFICA